MKNPERPPKPKVPGHCTYSKTHAHGSHHPRSGSFELKLTGTAVWLLASGAAALLYKLAERLGAG